MLTFAAGVLDAEFEACIVGAGPAGLACALDLTQRGVRVLVLEAGGERPVPGDPDLLAAEILHAEFHDPPADGAASALGGRSHWWGGRSAPLDPGDFDAWPISSADMQPWYERAAAFIGARAAHDTPAPGAFAHLVAFDATRDETWGPQLNMRKRWRHALLGAEAPAVLLGARVTGLERQAGAIAALRVRVGGEERRVRAKRFVLACGGLGCLKLLLLAQRDAPDLFGGADGPLGRGYFGHLTGSIAELEFSDARDALAFSGRLLPGAVWARRRIRPLAETASAQGMTNIAFWLENAAGADPSHGSAAGSAKYVAARAARALAGRGHDRTPLRPHLKNIANAPVSAAASLARAAHHLAVTRVTGRAPRPSLSVPAGRSRWRLDYHAEQKPDAANRVSLSPDRTDSIGAPALRVDFRFSEADAAAVQRAHDWLDRDLQAAGAGRLHMRAPASDLNAMIRGAARDGYHQLGGASMHADPKRGVVDATCRVHGLDNLWIASGSVFASGGQANPTLTIVALALRTADAVAR